MINYQSPTTFIAVVIIIMTVIRNLTRNLVYMLVLCCLLLLTSNRFLGSLIIAKLFPFQIWWPFSSIMILSLCLPEEDDTSCRKRWRLSPYHIAESDPNVSRVVIWPVCVTEREEHLQLQLFRDVIDVLSVRVYVTPADSDAANRLKHNTVIHSEASADSAAVCL